MVVLSWIFVTVAIASSVDAIIANSGTKGSTSNSSSITFTTEEPLRRQTPSDKSAGGRSAEASGHLNAEESVKRQAVYSGHHYPELHHNELSYGGGYGYGAEEGDYHHLPHHHHYHDHHVQDHGHYYHHQQHHHPYDHAHKALAVKGLLIPLAGIALLGAAAAFVSNPILLQLGVITGRRRRRSAASSVGPQEAEAMQQQLNDLVLLERFITQLPKDQAVAQEKQLLATYLSCSGSALANGTMCLERVTCEIHRPDSIASQLEKHVMNIITSEIFKNEYIPEQVKEKVRNAAARGSHSGDCSDFPCKDLEVEN